MSRKNICTSYFILSWKINNKLSFYPTVLPQAQTERRVPTRRQILSAIAFCIATASRIQLQSRTLCFMLLFGMVFWNKKSKPRAEDFSQGGSRARTNSAISWTTKRFCRSNICAYWWSLSNISTRKVVVCICCENRARGGSHRDLLSASENDALKPKRSAKMPFDPPEWLPRVKPSPSIRRLSPHSLFLSQNM